MSKQLAGILLSTLLFLTTFALPFHPDQPVAAQGSDNCGLAITTLGGGHIHAALASTADPDLSVTIGVNNDYVILENSQIRVRYDDFFQGHAQFSIKEFVLKATNQNQAGSLTDNNTFLDADSGRGTLRNATLIYDGPDRKTVRLVWDSSISTGRTITHDVSIFPNTRHLQIDYVDVHYGINIVDIGRPGGAGNGQHVFYNHDAWMAQENHNRENDPPGYGGYLTANTRQDLHGSYYNRYSGDGVNDPANGGVLNYNGHFIGAVYNPANGRGFGRVMPVGAVEIVKLLISQTQRNGSEIFPYPFVRPHAPFTGYLYAFTGGEAEAISLGQQIVDGTLIPNDSTQSGQCGAEATLTATSHTNWNFAGWSGSHSDTAVTTTLTLTTSHTITASFTHTATPIYENFDTYTTNVDPTNWYDTGANSTLVQNDTLFKTADDSTTNNSTTIATTSTANNIHSHYTTADSASLTDYTYSGRMMFTDTNGGIGVTLFSQYPSTQAYYRLHQYGASNTFRLTPSGATLSGSVDSGIVAQADTWYYFFTQIVDTGSQTEIKAKIWPEGSPEPGAWQIDAIDDSATRLTTGTFGLWSTANGSKYWDDLAISDADVVSTSAGNGPTIDVWYGVNQTFGDPGVPQRWANILGNVSDSDGVASLTFTLNNGAAKTLKLGPDNRRLAEPGDFNVEIDRNDLNPGANTVTITATDSVGNIAAETVTLTYTTGATWPLPYTADWDSLADAYVVDGRWSVDGSGAVRTDQVDYDRILALGDVTWSDYEVTVPVTVNDYDDSIFGDPYSTGPGLGIVTRWQGHTNDPVFCAQPHCGWLPQGSSNWYEWLQSQPDVLHIFAQPGSGSANTTAIQFTTGNTYWHKARAENTTAGPLYHFKVWEDGTPEPAAWTLQRQADPGNPTTGSILLVAHHVDATFGTVQVNPLHDLTVNTVGNGSVAANPNQSIKFTHGDTVTLTATADPGWEFSHWSGDLNGSNTTSSLTITGTTTVTATFVNGHTGGQGPGGLGRDVLALWLKADAGVYSDSGCAIPATNNTAVGCWADQSGNGLNALAGSSGPVFQATGALNMPTLTFNGSTQRLTTAPVSLFSSDGAGLTLITVFDTDNSNGGKYLLNLGVAPDNNVELGYGFAAGEFGISKSNGNAAVSPGGAISNDTFNILTTLVTPDGATPNNVNLYRNGTALSSDNNGSGWLDAGSYPTSAHPLDVGARNSAGSGSYDAYHDGDIAEIILFNHALNDARRIILDNYLNARYGIPIAPDLYGSTTYTMSVAGIGREANGQHNTAASDGLIISDDTGSLNDGDYLLIGHRISDNSNTAGDVPVGVQQRWERVWYVEKTTDSGIDVNMTFDISDSGMSGSAGAAENYILLYSDVNAFNWSEKITGATTVNGDQITFTVSDVDLEDGYYTLATADTANSPTAVSLQTLTAHAQSPMALWFAIAGLISLAAIALLRKSQENRMSGWRSYSLFPINSTLE